jgi:hypothetical protein
LQVAERASIHRETLRKIEKGDASVALGSYFNPNSALENAESIKQI